MCEMCVLLCFSEDPPGGLFPQGCVCVCVCVYLKIPSPYLWVTPGEIVFCKKYTSPRGGNSEDTTVVVVVVPNENN